MIMRNWLLCGLLAGIILIPIPVSAADSTAADPLAASESLADPELAFHSGVQLYRSGKLAEANNHFLDYLYRFPDTEWLHQIQLYLARIALDQNNNQKALIFVQQIPETLRSAEARFIAGVAHVRLGDYQLGSMLLKPLQEAPLFDADRILLYSALGDAHAALQDSLQALFYYQRALEMGGDQGRLIQRGHTLISEMSEAALEEVVLVFDGSIPALDARLQLARKAIDAGRTLQARRLITEVQRDRTPFPYRGEIPALLDRLTGGNWLQRDTLGVILPLTGRYAPFGKLAQRGIEMARRNYPELKLVYRDSAANPDQTTGAVIELGNSERVMAILGPLASDVSQAAAERAEMDAVPLLSLSQKEDLPQVGRYIFRNSLTNRLQARELARYCVTERGLTSFATLYPNNRKGQELAEQFAEEVKKLGGLVVESAEYNPEKTDFRQQIIPFIGEDVNTRYDDDDTPDHELSDKERQRRQLPPETTFEALFIPDFAENVAMLLPQLVYYGVENVQLLGTNGWYSPKLVRNAGERYVNGAVLVNGFFPHSSYPFVREFVDRYYQEFKQDPSFIEAQAYDAANILFSLLSDPQIESREDLLTALTQLRNYPGVTGATSFDFQGEVDKRLFLLRVDHGNFVQIN